MKLNRFPPHRPMYHPHHYRRTRSRDAVHVLRMKRCYRRDTFYPSFKHTKPPARNPTSRGEAVTKTRQRSSGVLLKRFKLDNGCPFFGDKYAKPFLKVLGSLSHFLPKIYRRKHHCCLSSTLSVFVSIYPCCKLSSHTAAL